MARAKRITLHPLKNNGQIDTSIDLLPKTSAQSLVDENGNTFVPQEKLIAGPNITIEGNIISSTGGGGSGEVAYEVVVTDLDNIFNQDELQVIWQERPSTIHLILQLSGVGNGDQYFRRQINLPDPEEGVEKLIYASTTDDSSQAIVVFEEDGQLEYVKTEIDFTELATKQEVSAKQDTLTFDNTPTQNSSNPVTSDGIWRECQDIRNIAEGVSKSYVIDTELTYEIVKERAIELGYTILDEQGNDITQDFIYGENGWDTNEYENYRFESNSNFIDIDTAYLFLNDTGTTITVVEIASLNFRKGDVCYVTAFDMPDRWFGGYVNSNKLRFYVLEGKNATNIANGAGELSLKQKPYTDSSSSDVRINFTGRNPHAEALDSSLTDTFASGATAIESAAFNGNTMSFAKRAFTNGNKTIAKGEESHAEGYCSVTLGDGSHAEGNITVAAGDSAHSEGYNTQAIGDESHAEGYDTLAEADSSHAEGVNTIVKREYIVVDSGAAPDPTPSPVPTPADPDSLNGMGAHAEGHDTFAFGLGSHAEGYANKSYGRFSHAEGYATQTGTLELSYTEDGKDYYTIDHTKQFQHAEGSETKAIGFASHAGGLGTIAGYDYQTAIGKYNENKSDTLFEIGRGNHDLARVNAFEVHDDGRATIGAKPTDAMDVVNKGFLSSNIKTINGQSLLINTSADPDDIQISVSQSGLFKHEVEFADGTYITFITTSSAQLLATDMLDTFNFFENCIKALYHNASTGKKDLITQWTGQFLSGPQPRANLSFYVCGVQSAGSSASIYLINMLSAMVSTDTVTAI